MQVLIAKTILQSGCALALLNKQNIKGGLFSHGGFLNRIILTTLTMCSRHNLFDVKKINAVDLFTQKFMVVAQKHKIKPTQMIKNIDS